MGQQSELERGQQTLDKWLSRGRSSRGGRGGPNTNSHRNTKGAMNLPNSATSSDNETNAAASNAAESAATSSGNDWSLHPQTGTTVRGAARASQISGAILATANDNVDPPERNWSSVTYNPRFRRGRNGIVRDPTDNSLLARLNERLPQNPLVHSTTMAGTLARVFNGVVNGAIVGSVLAGGGGLIVGGIMGAVGGAFVDQRHHAREERDISEMRRVADMLANDDGAIEREGLRVHRGRGYITALSSNDNGHNRAIRVRYSDSPRARQLRIELSRRVGNVELRRQMEGSREDVERSLLDILVRMSYSHDFGPGPGDNLILQPEESLEQLTIRFGLGNVSRGASQEIIDSYPVQVLGRPEGQQEEEDNNSDSTVGSDSDYDDESSDGSQGEYEVRMPENAEELSHGSLERDAEDMGTCGICLEDYKEGDLLKTLTCPSHPHRFHKECINKWLGIEASCPICKSRVGIYKEPCLVAVVRGDEARNQG